MAASAAGLQLAAVVTAIPVLAHVRGQKVQQELQERSQGLQKAVQGDVCEGFLQEAVQEEMRQQELQAWGMLCLARLHQVRVLVFSALVATVDPPVSASGAAVAATLCAVHGQAVTKDSPKQGVCHLERGQEKKMQIFQMGEEEVLRAVVL